MSTLHVGISRNSSRLVARASGRAEQALFCSESLNQFAKFLARFEEGNSLRWHFDSVSGFWITSDARSSLARVEGPESTNFNFVPGSKGTDDAVEYSANDDVGFLPGQLNGLINLFGQICPGHLVYSLRQRKEYHRVTGCLGLTLGVSSSCPSAAALPPRRLTRPPTPADAMGEVSRSGGHRRQRDRRLIYKKWGIIARLDSDQSRVLTTLEVIGFIPMRPTDLDKNALFVQPICHM